MYKEAVYHGGRDEESADADAVFTEKVFQALRTYLCEEAFITPILLTETLSNRVLAVHLTGKSGERLIAVNTRFRVDPDVVAYTLIEEFVHTQQVIDGIDFATQRSQFSYEIEAKRIATEILGYDPGDYETYIRRDEPEGVLYDKMR